MLKKSFNVVLTKLVKLQWETASCTAAPSNSLTFRAAIQSDDAPK